MAITLSTALHFLLLLKLRSWKLEMFSLHDILFSIGGTLPSFPQPNAQPQWGYLAVWLLAQYITELLVIQNFSFPLHSPTVQRTQAFIPKYVLTPYSVQTHVMYAVMNETAKDPAIMGFSVYSWRKITEKYIKSNKYINTNWNRCSGEGCERKSQRSHFRWCSQERPLK